MFRFIETIIPGCFEIQAMVRVDSRGKFVKIFQEEVFCERGLNLTFKESYFSVSFKNVIRGLHFQLPPYDHEKLIHCADGQIFDVLVDLRRGSPAYGAVATFNLSSEIGNMVFAPKGVAHGFCAIKNNSLVMYNVTTSFNERFDGGIRWDSLGISWPTSSPVISERDVKLKPFSEFISPFIYEQ